MSVLVPDLTDADLVFPARALSWMPTMEQIPKEFRDGDTEWNQIASQWFYAGISDDAEFVPREGIDPVKAVRALKATLGSYAPKHEHKEAAVAYMMSCWFTKVEKWKL